MLHFKIPPFSTPPSNAALDVTLESDNEEEEQEFLEDLEYEEQEGRRQLPRIRWNLTFFPTWLTAYQMFVQIKRTQWKRTLGAWCLRV